MVEKKRILIVDDDPEIRDLLEFDISSSGYFVDIATDGMEGLNKALNNKYDIILLDVMMPNLDGWATLKAIRKHASTKYIPVIMLTAVSDEQKVVTGLKIGADDYITKPFVLPNLLARMEAVLRRNEWAKEATSAKRSLKSDSPLKTLTNREREVLSLAAKGASNKDIAEKLVLREVTVKSHLNSIFKKLNVTSRTQAVLLAMQTDLIKN